MNRLALLGATAAIGVVLVGGALLVFRPGRGPGVGGPSPAAIPSSATVGPSGSSAAAASSSTALLLEKTFTSALYGYTVDIPAGWTRLPAALEWTAGSVNNWASGFNDELKGTDIRFSGAAQVLAKGQTADDWLAAYASGGDPKKWPRVRIDGQIGSIDADGVPALGGTIVPGGRMYDAVVVSRNVAFNFNMDGNVDRATFDARVVGRLDAHCPDFYLEAVVPTSGRVYILTLYAPVTRPEFRAFLDTIHLTPATAKN